MISGVSPSRLSLSGCVQELCVLQFIQSLDHELLQRICFQIQDAECFTAAADRKGLVPKTVSCQGSDQIRKIDARGKRRVGACRSRIVMPADHRHQRFGEMPLLEQTASHFGMIGYLFGLALCGSRSRNPAKEAREGAGMRVSYEVVCW